MPRASHRDLVRWLQRWRASADLRSGSRPELGEDIEDEEEDREDEEKKIDGNLEKYGLLLISKLGLDKNNSDLRKLILDNCDLKDDITTKICYDKKGESKGCGIIKYKNEEDARKILQKFKSAKVFDPMEFFWFLLKKI